MTRLFAYILTFVLMASQGVAKDSAIDGLESITLIKGWRMENGRHMGAVSIKLEKGWKTYWRVAGRGGIPPRFDWNGSKNLKATKIHWPRPDILDEDGYLTVGYKDEIVIPLELTPAASGKNIAAKLTLDFGICSDICIPAQVVLSEDFSTRLAFGKTEIQTALNKKVPISNEAAKCNFAPFNKGMAIRVSVPKGAADAGRTAIYVEYPSNDWINQGPTQLAGNRLEAEAKYYSKTPVIERSKLRITKITPTGAAEYSGCQ